MTDPADDKKKAGSWDFAALDAAGAALAGRVGGRAETDSAEALEAGADAAESTAEAAVDHRPAGGPPDSSLSTNTDSSGAESELAAESADSSAAETADSSAAVEDRPAAVEDHPAAEDPAVDLENLQAAGGPPDSSVSADSDSSGAEDETEPESADNSEPAYEPEAAAAPDAEPDVEADAEAQAAAGAPEAAAEAAAESELEADAQADADAQDAAAVSAAVEAADLANAEPEAIEDSGLPDLADDQEFDGALESVLLVVDSPVNEEQLSSALEQPVKRVKEALRRISTRYTESGSGIDLRRVGDGWRFYTRDRYAPFVEKLLLDGQRAKLTRAALETLAVIAYRQPVTRARIAAVRGVNVDGVIRTLVARGLIEEIGTDSDTGGILYRTTELFLERLGLPSLADLPPIAPLLPEVDAIDDV